MSGLGAQGYSLTAIVVVLAILLLRNSRAQRLRIERMWVRPVIFGALMVTSIGAAPPPASVMAIGVLAAAFVAGGALGWQRGRLMRIEAHPETHDLSMRASPLGMIFILALVALRFGMRSLAANATVIGIPAGLAADSLIVLAAATMMAQSLEMWLRARRILAESQAAKAARIGSPPIVQ